MLELINVSLTFESDKGSVEILKDINITFNERQLYVFTGPNGGGKSSLAKVIMGIYKPSGGKIILDGQDITELGVTERARLGIGYAFQQPPRFKGITVSELLRLAVGQSEIDKEFGLLFDVGLCPQDYIDREVDVSLSGGELKRIEIASLLARDLKLAVYDEPEAGIDLWSFSRLTETFQNFHKTHDTTVILISHQERILSIADEIVLVADGLIREQGSRDAVWPLIMDSTVCSFRDACFEGTEANVECNR
ncbi:MAG: ATP-binding cassette domain-containing protein [Peptococcaceae bacterium]|nr:ATP-binding cassette domain-containing protein [Peptococcaceae bacterium]